MFYKSVRVMLLLAGAGGISYAWFNPDVAKAVKEKWNAWRPRFGDAQVSEYDEGSLAFGGPTVPQPGFVPEGVVVAPPTGGKYPLEEVLRFDISPRWVVEHWGRVSTLRSPDDLEGLRVPLVTGTDLAAVTGSLTYYFNHQQQVQRITLDGHTGDDRRLVSVVTARFKLRHEAGRGAGLYVARWNGQPTSVLRISHGKVIRSDAPHARLHFSLELNQPYRDYRLGAAAPTVK